MIHTVTIRGYTVKVTATDAPDGQRSRERSNNFFSERRSAMEYARHELGLTLDCDVEKVLIELVPVTAVLQEEYRISSRQKSELARRAAAIMAPSGNGAVTTKSTEEGEETT
jgi:hypothetical protein